MVGLAAAVERLTLQRDGFAKAVDVWRERHDELGMRLRDLLGARDHEIVSLTRANRELTEKVRKLEKRRNSDTMKAPLSSRR
jgi:kynureninase